VEERARDAELVAVQFLHEFMYVRHRNQVVNMALSSFMFILKDTSLLTRNKLLLSHTQYLESESSFLFRHTSKMVDTEFAARKPMDRHYAFFPIPSRIGDRRWKSRLTRNTQILRA
jgi:hypothetical protein